MMWDPAQYSRFRDQRSRPFFELLARIRHLQPSKIVDLGCGTGALSEVLADLWPDADIQGIDRSAEMLESARQITRPNLHFQQNDISNFAPSGEDLIFSNAALHWIRDHESLLLRFAKSLQPGGALAFQVPSNFDAPSHVLLRKICNSPEWRAALGNSKDLADSRSAVEYARSLLNHGFTVDAWETNYVQVLHGDDAVFEWMAGSTLRPIFATLNDRQEERFSAEYKALLRSAYPPNSYGTVYEFRRVFVIAQAPESDTQRRSAPAYATEQVGISRRSEDGDEVPA
jgi:trans-aconitate 2-methyltransferase